MRRLIRSRPPFSNLFNHPHRRLKSPQSPSDKSRLEEEEDQSSPSTDSPSQTEDKTPVELTLNDLPESPKILPGLKHVDSELIVREFDSFYDFITCAVDSSLITWESDNCHSRRKESSSKWRGTATFDEAVELALNGWPEGRNLMSESLALAQPFMKPEKLEIYDVAGAFPLVPLYCAGDPASMVDFHSDHLATRPVITICANISANAGISPEAFITHGAAILTFAADLEARGHSVELQIADISLPAYRRSSPSLLWSFIFKKAGENLDIDRAAFALAHPSILRRFSFAITEQHKILEKSMAGNYGKVGSIPQTNPNTIYIPSPSGSTDPKIARKIVETAAQWLKTQELPKCIS